jgi:adenylate cyclase
MQQAEVRLLEVDEAIGDSSAKELAHWLLRHGLTEDSEQMLLEGFCARLLAHGFRLTRASCATDLLHPVLEARAYFWRRGRPTEQQDLSRDAMDETGEDWLRSPFHHLLQQTPEGDGLLTVMRRHLEFGYERGEFPLLDKFQDEGMTDYIAMRVRFGEGVSLGKVEGLVCSWQTDRPGGFTDQQVELLRRLVPAFALSYKAISSVQTGRTLMATYLGTDAGRRVLEGAIERGKAETVRAVLWYSDLQGFTRIADTIPQEELLSLLNDYADGVVKGITKYGGDVLKFIGDGILAMFPMTGEGDECARALDAAIWVRNKLELINNHRREQGKPVTGMYLALHFGDVLYGNVGSRERLDFTVVGPAVNEAARIEAMCRSLDQWLIVSSAFAEASGHARGRLVSLGRYALRGVRRPEELFTLDPES